MTEPAPGAYELILPAVRSILRQNEHAKAAFLAMRERGLSEEEAREEIARVLLAVMYHVGAESERVQAVGGGGALRRDGFQRLAQGETAAEIFGE